MAKANLPLHTFSIKTKGQHQSVSDRFWSFIHKTDSCWIWKGQIIKDGYGRIRVWRQNILAHRLSFAIAHGRMPEGCVLHSCDNPPCVNPDHLHEGTHADNMREMKERGRMTRCKRGADVAVSKLTERDIPQIRAMLLEGHSQESIAKQFGVSQVAISMIGRNKTWRHV